MCYVDGFSPLPPSTLRNEHLKLLVQQMRPWILSSRLDVDAVKVDMTADPSNQNGL